MTLAEDRVAAGAKLLDEKIPDWWQQIDIESLDMSEPCRCVLGQLGGKEVNLDALGWDHAHEIDHDFYGIAELLYGEEREWISDEHGFDLPLSEIVPGESENVYWVDLRDAWVVEIEKRRAA